MKTPIKLSEAFTGDAMLKRIFTWLARIGAGPKFGSRPIGWYQVHMCNAIDELKKRGADIVTSRNGVIHWTVNGEAQSITASELYTLADKR